MTDKEVIELIEKRITIMDYRLDGVDYPPLYNTKTQKFFEENGNDSKLFHEVIKGIVKPEYFHKMQDAQNENQKDAIIFFERNRKYFNSKMYVKVFYKEPIPIVVIHPKNYGKDKKKQSL